jgi:hypothetical protein
MKEIKLQNGLVALVDDEDYDHLIQYKWRAIKARDTFYAVDSSRKNNRMHRIIMNTAKGMEVDHRDHNGLNNQKTNLRNCSFQENRRNRKKNINCIIPYKGVSISRQTRNNKLYCYIQATIKVNNKAKFLGFFPTPLDAAKAYDKAAKKYFGEFANLNFK